MSLLLGLTGCGSWQARQVVEPERVAWEAAQGAAQMLAEAESKGVLVSDEALVGTPGVVYRYAVLRPSTAEYSFEDQNDEGAYGFSFSWSLGEPLRCEAPRTLLFLHGYGANAMQAMVWAPPLMANCWTVIAPDLRAHGRSGGDQVTFGVRELPELLSLLETLEAEGVFSGPVSVLGLSFGGSLALSLNAAGYPFEHTIAVAPFERGDAAMDRAIQRYQEGLDKSQRDTLIRKASELAGFNWNDTVVQGQTTGQVHVIASTADRINPAAQACELAARLGATCHELNDPRWKHDTLMLPTQAVRQIVLPLLEATP